MKGEYDKVYKLLKANPVFRVSEAGIFGIHRKTLHRMTQQNQLIRLCRGLYADPNHIPGVYQSVIEAQKAVPRGVVCLFSALSIHEIGIQNPSTIWMALPRGTRVPRTGNLPLDFVHYSLQAYEEGRTTRVLDGVDIQVYNIPKTIADCFKFRNRIGLDIAIEALKDVVSNRRATNDEILKAAQICRVESVITPYLESLQ